MTREQARIAAQVLEQFAPTDHQRYAACLAAIEHLQNLEVSMPAVWSLHCSTLFAGDPGGRVLSFERPPAFAGIAPASWSRPCEIVRIGFASRETAKAQRYRLAERLRKRGLHTLAKAVSEIKLQSFSGAVMAIYEPEGLPIQVRGK